MLIASEQFTTTTLLGIRFWDPVFDQQIDSDLMVTARVVQPLSVQISEKVTRAIRTPGGIYSFSHLPGMRSFEYGYDDVDSINSPNISSPDIRREFIIEIRDVRRRFINIAFNVELPLPYKGLFLNNSSGSPAEDMPKGLHLFSSTTRQLPGNMAVIRGELLQKTSRAPAAHALLKVEFESGESWHGIADKRGHFAIVFPWPELIEGFTGSPGSESPGSLYEQTWDLALSVFYSPASQQPLQGAATPDYLSILSQVPADIWPESDSSVSQLSLTLEYYQQLVTKTHGLSELLVSPLPS